MKKIAILVFFTVGFFVHVWACTGLIAGKQATVDGSVLVTYSADSHTLYGALTSSPAADWPKGSMRSIVEWDTNKPLGEIEQVEHTYAVIGNMNEHQLTVVESTWGGRPELVDTTGIIDLLLVYQDKIKIIDYKTKNLDDPHYIEQLHTYRNAIRQYFGENIAIGTYFYSIIDGVYKSI